MQKLLILLVCGFAFTQSIQTKQVEVTITDIGQFETMMGNHGQHNGELFYGLNIGQYISLLEGTYLLELTSFESESYVNGSLDGLECSGDYSGFWWSNNGGGCPFSDNCNQYGGEPLRITYDCQSMFF